MFSIIDIFIHISNGLFVIGSSFRKILWMRVTFILAATAELVYDFFSQNNPLWSMIIWCFVLILTNSFQIYLLIKDHFGKHLTDEIKQIKDNLFPKLDKFSFSTLMRAGEWRDFVDDDLIIKENELTNSVFLILDGTAEIVVNEKVVAFVTKWQFLGEMSFLTGTPATATVKAASKMKLFAWSKDKLTKLIADNHELNESLKDIFSGDLINKINIRNKN